jgi:hypothetical protein
MYPIYPSHMRNTSRMIISLLMILILTACGAQPTAAPTSVPPTQTMPAPTATSVPPTEVLPFPTSQPPTATPLPPVQAGSLDEILGAWSAVCGSGTCVIKFFEDGTYRHWYVKTTEGGVSEIDAGTITYTDGVFQLVSVNGSCEKQASGYYSALLSIKDDKPFLKFTATQADECPDRQNSVSRGMPEYTE